MQKLPTNFRPQYFVPWFLVRQPKLRLIVDCREINRAMYPPDYFRLPNWSSIYPCLRKGWHAAKLDLRHAYFHLELHESLKQLLLLQVGEHFCLFLAAPFGLACLPLFWTKVMRVLEKRWHAKGMLVFVYLDDIILLGETASRVRAELQKILKDLLRAGLHLNVAKSILHPCQELEHLGLLVNLCVGQLQVPHAKRATYRRGLAKLVRMSAMSVRKMASILGKVRSILFAVPAIRAFSDHMVEFVRQNQVFGWDSVHPVPSCLKAQVCAAKEIMFQWPGRPFLTPACVPKRVFSDASQLGWGGLDTQSGQVVHDFFYDQGHWHINIKELHAAVSTIMSLVHPGDVVEMCIDNLVVFYYLKNQGGRKLHFNAMLRPLLLWAMKNRVQIFPVLVPTLEMKLDHISRWRLHPEDYSLAQNIFRQVLTMFLPFRPEVDMFTSPGNRKLPKVVSRFPHHEAYLVDALQCPLHTVGCVFANPPWELVAGWLHRLIQNPHILSL